MISSNYAGERVGIRIAIRRSREGCLRRSSILTISAMACVLFGLAAVRLNSRPSSAEAAEPQGVQQAAVAAAPQAVVQPVSVVLDTTTKVADLPLHQPTSTPGSDIYTAKRGETIPGVARQQLKYTAYLTSSELAEAIRQTNGNRTGNILKAGEQITIPGILAAPIVEKTVPVAKD